MINSMKKIITLCVCTLMAITSIYAQDIIVTKDAKKLEVKITEVSKSEIRYKELDNLDGPTFVLEMSDISSIIYSNGKVFIPESSQTSEDPSSLSESNQESNNKEISSFEIDEINGHTYISEGGEIKLKYDFSNKRIYIQSQTPLMYHNKDVRNIVIVYFHFGDKDKYIFFDMYNKVEGVALLSGLNAFVANINFHSYFKKHMPNSFKIEVSYETSQATYTMRAAN